MSVGSTWRGAGALSMLFGLAACEGPVPRPTTGPDAGAPAVAAAPPTTCPSQPQRLAILRFGAEAVALDAAHLYVGTRDGLSRVPKAGGALTQLAAIPGGAGPMAADDTHVYLGARYEPSGLFAVPKAGGAAISLDDTRGFVRPRVSETRVDADHVYYLENGGRIESISKSDRTARRIVLSDSEFIFGFVMDATSIYWTRGYELLHTPLSGGAAVTLVNTLWEAIPFGIDDSHIYYWSENAAGLYRVGKQGGEEEALGGFPDDAAGRVFALDAAGVYATGSTGRVWRMPKTGGAWTLVAEGGAFDAADDEYRAFLAIDELSVYWQAGPPGQRVSWDNPLWLMRVCK